MEKEKIISEILGKVGNTDVSQQTVESLINLNPLAEGTEPDEAYFEKMSGVVKSFQGNINHVFSSKLSEQVEQKVADFKKNYKPTGTPTPTPTPQPVDDKYAKLEEEIKRLQEARSEDLARAYRNDAASRVKSGLREKFRSSGMDVKDFFIDTALSKMEIPTENANVDALIAEAEKNVVKDMKAAGLELDAPTAGSVPNGNGKSWLDKKFAEKAKREGYAK